MKNRGLPVRTYLFALQRNDSLSFGLGLEMIETEKEIGLGRIYEVSA